MKNFNFGIKLWSNESYLLKEAVKLIDEGFFSYVEVILNPDFLEEKPFLEHKIPYVVHTPHENFGVDIGDKSKREYTIKMVKESIRWANMLDAKFIILHAGTGSAETARATLSEINDSRTILENMPVKGIYGNHCLGYNAKSISELIGRGNLGLCLDFGHAIKASLSLRRDYKEIISEFMGLNPKIFHASDGKLDKEIDEHLNIGEGAYDFDFIKEIIKKSDKKYVTIETPRPEPHSLEDDIKNLMKLKEFIESVL